MVLEICAYSVEAALVAQNAGADRIELCSSPEHGGTTPGYGSIQAARERLKVPLHVMVRPRGGDFLYSPAELDAMRADITACKRLGVNGVALGVLTQQHHVDQERCAELVALAAPMRVTFHRAFDVAPDRRRALEDVIATGCDRVLTSGGAECALTGAKEIRALVEQAAGRIIVIAGGGVRAENLPELLSATGTREFHSSARTAERGLAGFGEHVTVDAESVAAMKRVLAAASR